MRDATSNCQCRRVVTYLDGKLADESHCVAAAADLDKTAQVVSRSVAL